MGKTIVFVDSAEAVRVNMLRGKPLEDLLEFTCSRCGQTALIARDALETYQAQEGPDILLCCEHCLKDCQARGLVGGDAGPSHPGGPDGPGWRGEILSRPGR